MDTVWTQITVTSLFWVNSFKSSLLAEDVQGRVDITRTFDGRELNTEYLFGLFANLATSAGFSLLGVPETTHFAASQNIASASTTAPGLDPLERSLHSHLHPREYSLTSATPTCPSTPTTTISSHAG